MRLTKLAKNEVIPPKWSQVRAYLMGKGVEKLHNTENTLHNTENTHYVCERIQLWCYVIDFEFWCYVLVLL